MNIYRDLAVDNVQRTFVGCRSNVRLVSFAEGCGMFLLTTYQAYYINDLKDFFFL